MKGIFLVLDGVADEPCQSLGHCTPLQVAKTPNLDALARMSDIDSSDVVKPGVASESSRAMVSLLGFDSNHVSRGPLELIGARIKCARGDLVLRTNFATIDDIKNKNIIDRRAGRTLNTKDAKVLAKAINTKVKLPFKFKFYPTNQHRGVLVFRGGFSDNISNVDPDYGSGSAFSVKSGKFAFSKPLDEEEDSKLSADLVNRFVRESHRVLDKHPLNKARARKGLHAANFLLCREPGTEIPKFNKLKGRWMALAYTPLISGISRASNMDIYGFSYPKMKGTNVYANLNDALSKAIKSSIKMIRKYKSKYDYFYLNFREMDVPGRDGKPLDKVKMIEMVDKRFFSFLKRFVERNNIRLVVVSSQVTSSNKRVHTASPVPVLTYPGKNDPVRKRFTEEQANKGKKLSGRRLVEKNLFG